MRCDHHDLFLVKQPLSCETPCCVLNCGRSARWKCQGRGRRCCRAVCLGHGNDLFAIVGNTVVNVELDMPGRSLQRARQVDDDDDQSELSDVEPTSNDASFEEDWEADELVLAPLGLEDASDGNAPPLHARRDMVPIYDANAGGIPSHFLWNEGYHVKRCTAGYSGVRGNALMQHIVDTTNNASVGLLYPEAQLFPRIFWSETSGSIVGAIPSFMLNSAASQFRTLASLEEHHSIRLRDGDILTSKQNGYWHYIFDLKLNRAMNSVPSKLIFRRGLEFLHENAEHHAAKEYATELRLPMDEAESSQRIKELASLLKKGKWNYFLTITCNDSDTPGVREITRAIKDFAGGDDAMLRELTDAYLPFTLRAWYRFVRVFLEELLMRNELIMGPVKSLFYRFEWQDAGSPGNKCHVHAGITVQPEPDIDTVCRICCMSTAFHTELYGADFKTLQALGVFVDETEFNRWREIISFVAHHNCANTNYRCMKATSADGTKICRYKRQPEIPMKAGGRGWFDEVPLPYPEDVYALLERMGLAHKVDDPWEGHRWVLHPRLTAGKWHYPSRSDEFFMASIPLVSAICLSATNVDMCDEKFQVNYLVKYVAGKTIRKL